MIRIAVCDDDRNFADIVDHYVSKCMENQLKLEYSIVHFNSLQETEEYINSEKTDILFLDIMVNGQNSMNWSIENIKNEHIQLIFMTSYPQSAYNISESRCCYYLVKSRINSENIHKALQRAIENLTKKQSELSVIKSGQSNLTVDLHCLMYIETENNYISLHMTDGRKVTVYARMKEYEKKLPKNFLRFHKCYTVNMDCIGGFSRYKFILKNGEELPIPQKKFAEVTDKYKNYIDNI